MPIPGFFRRVKSQNKSDSDPAVRPETPKPKPKKIRLGHFGSLRSQPSGEEASNAGPSSSIREVVTGEPAQQLAHVPLVPSDKLVAISSNVVVSAPASPLALDEEPISGETAFTRNAQPPAAATDHLVLQGDPTVIPHNDNAASRTSSPSLVVPLPDVNTGAGAPEQRPNIDASVRVTHQGVTYNVGRYANVTLVYGSQINQHEEHYLVVAIENLRRSHNAEFDMTANTNRGPCTPETRTVIIKELVEWCNSDKISLYWMNGMAGTGKTTITYSLCQLLAKANLLGASFFCSRSLPDCRDPNLIIPTIVFQLAKKYAPFVEALAKALKKDGDILHRGLDTQLHELLIKPWNERKSELPSHAVIVVDAVDECDDKDSTFLRAISDHAGKFPFKFLVTSRPEPSIHSVMMAKDRETLLTFILHEVEESLVEEDISRYVEFQLKKCLPSLSSSDARLLSKQCGKFFIYAATLCRFILDEDGNHLERFRLLLSLTPSDAREMAIQPIDALYIEILRRAFSTKKLRSEINSIKLVFHTVVCAREPLTRDAIAHLLELTAEEVEAHLKSLRSLVFIPQAIDQPLSTFHASLPDFMMDESRSGHFHCQPYISNLEIFKRCLALLKRELRRNICEVEEHLPNGSIQPGTIDEHIGPGLQYASIYWPEHWELCDLSGRQTVVTSMYGFLITDLALYWFECLSLIQRLPGGIKSLEMLQDGINENPEVATLVYNLLRSVQYFYNDIETSAMSVYSSVLIWGPSQSSLQKHYTSLRKHIPQVLCGLPVTWPRLERAINIHSDTVYSIAISQDDRYIVSGSADNTVRIWNVRSHIEECVLSGHTDEINSVAISGDGSRAISGSDDGNVVVWNIATREAVFTLESDSQVWAVAMSPVSKWIASGHDDSVVRVWNGVDGRLVHSLQGHTDWASSVIFTPDGKWLISGSWDKTARIWNTKTGEAEYILRGHTGYVRSVACSPDGEKVITGSYDDTARLWNISGKELHVLRGHSDDVNCVAFMPNGERVVTGSDDKTLRIWDVTSGDTVHIFTGLADEVRSVAVFPDGLKITSSSGKTISIWSSRGGDGIGGEEKNEDASLAKVAAESMAFSANGRRVLLLPSLRILDTATLEEKVVIGSYGVKYSGGALSTTGSRVAASAKKVIEVWELTDDVVANYFTLQGHTDDIRSLSFSHDERQLVSASKDKTAQIWDVATRNQIHSLNHRFWVRSAAFSHDDAQIVSAATFTIHVWNAQSGEQLRQFDAEVYSVAFSPDDRHIITSYDGAISIYNTNTPRLDHTKKGYRSWLTMNDGSSYALSDDCQWVCCFPRFSDKSHRLLWIPYQYRPILDVNDSPLFSPTPTGVQVCLPRRDGLVTLILPHDV